MEQPIHSNANSENIGLRSLIVAGLRRWRLFLVAFLCSCVLAVVYLVVIPTTYDVLMRILVQGDDSGSPSFGLGEAAGMMKSFGLGKLGGGSISIDDEMALLSSHSLLRNVVRSLGMQVEYRKPGSFLHKLHTDNTPLLLTFSPATGDNVREILTFKVRMAADGGARIRVKERLGKRYDFDFRTLPAVISIPQGEFTLSRNQDVAPLVGRMRIVVSPISWVAESLAKDILVEEESKNSDVINLGYQDHERTRAIEVLSMLVAEYNREQTDARRHRTAVPLEFVEGRIRSVLADLDAAESALQDFKHVHNLTDLEFDMQFYIDQMQDLQTQLIETEAEAYVISLMEDFVRNPENRYNLVPLLLSARDGEAGGGAFSLYNEKLLERTQLLRSARPESPLVSRLDEQLDGLRGGVMQSISQARAGYNQTLADLRRRERIIRDKMGQVPALENEYVNHKRRQEIFQGVYLILLQKREELAITAGELQDRARIIEQPYVKRKRAAPRKLYAGLGAIAFTVLVPIGILFFRRQYVAICRDLRESD
jgi:uncharacterized protein involved in exopolysaccharide biosynthesis